MAKFTLDIEYEYDFGLIGISCHAKDYRFCWALNNVLKTDFLRIEDIVVKNKLKSVSFPHFIFNDEDLRIDYSVIANRGLEGYLLPEQKQADYLLMLSGSYSDEIINETLKKVKTITLVLTAFIIDVKGLKNKQNLIL
jgi:hypothetical protein